jgi:hypothetical protein
MFKALEGACGPVTSISTNPNFPTNPNNMNTRLD